MHAWPDGQACPHAPQLATSVLMSTQLQPQSVSFGPQPGGMHAPEVQVLQGGQTLPQGQWQMNQELYRQVFSTRHMRLGDAARAAKQGTTDADVRRTWILFGDPTMRLK